MFVETMILSSVCISTSLALCVACRCHIVNRLVHFFDDIFGVESMTEVAAENY